MYVEEVCIEGFKSYAQRTVVPAFDPLFNAITGLNGSGKSNILDSICFVLGITNLSQVRDRRRPRRRASIRVSPARTPPDPRGAVGVPETAPRSDVAIFSTFPPRRVEPPLPSGDRAGVERPRDDTLRHLRDDAPRAEPSVLSPPVSSPSRAVTRRFARLLCRSSCTSRARRA